MYVYIYIRDVLSRILIRTICEITSPRNPRQAISPDFPSVSSVVSHEKKNFRSLRYTSRGTLTIISMPFITIWLYVPNTEYFISWRSGECAYPKERVNVSETRARAILNARKFTGQSGQITLIILQYISSVSALPLQRPSVQVQETRVTMIALFTRNTTALLSSKPVENGGDFGGDSQSYTNRDDV